MNWLRFANREAWRGGAGSSDWVASGWDTSYSGGYSDACVVKLSALGAHLWSSYLGGSNDDEGYGITVKGAGNVFVTGYTFSSGWVSGRWDTSFDGNGKAFLIKIHQ